MADTIAADLAAIRQSIEAAKTAGNGAVRTAVEGHRQTLAQIGALVGEVGGKIAETQSKLEEARRQIEKMLDDAGNRLGELSTARQEAKAAGEQAMETLEGGVDSMLASVDELRKNVQEKGEEVLETMTSKVAEELLAPVDELREECNERVSSLIEKVADQMVPDKATEAVDEWCEELRSEMKAMIDQLQSVLAQFREQTIGGTEAAGSSRSSSEVSAEALRSALSPVTTALDRVRGLAETVGISI